MYRSDKSVSLCRCLINLLIPLLVIAGDLYVTDKFTEQLEGILITNDRPFGQIYLTVQPVALKGIIES